MQPVDIEFKLKPTAITSYQLLLSRQKLHPLSRKAHTFGAGQKAQGAVTSLLQK